MQVQQPRDTFLRVRIVIIGTTASGRLSENQNVSTNTNAVHDNLRLFLHICHLQEIYHEVPNR